MPSSHMPSPTIRSLPCHPLPWHNLTGHSLPCHLLSCLLLFPAISIYFHATPSLSFIPFHVIIMSSPHANDTCRHYNFYSVSTLLPVTPISNHIPNLTTSPQTTISWYNIPPTPPLTPSHPTHGETEIESKYKFDMPGTRGRGRIYTKESIIDTQEMEIKIRPDGNLMQDIHLICTGG